MKDDKEFHHPAYINIPYFVLKEKRLDLFNKLLFSFFWSFSVAGKKIKASNDYLADLFGVTDKHIQNRIKMLEDLGFINRKMVKYKRVIEITHLVLTEVESDSGSPNLSLVPPTVGASTNNELPPTTVGVSHQPQLVPAPTTVGTYNKAIPKKDNKITPISPSGKKSSFSLSQMLEDNPFNIPEAVLADWIEVRKGKRAKLTPTAWEQANKNLVKLKEAGLDPNECFVKAVGNGWAGVEFRYFKQDIEALTPRPNKYLTADEREAAKQKSLQLEMKAQLAKQQEIQASKGFKDIVAKAKTKAERDAEYEAKRKAMNMTVQEYSAYVLKQAAEGVNRSGM